eukprot:758738-Hanusia_phi.AAC.7
MGAGAGTGGRRITNAPPPLHLSYSPPLLSSPLFSSPLLSSHLIYYLSSSPLIPPYLLSSPPLLMKRTIFVNLSPVLVILTCMCTG